MHGRRDAARLRHCNLANDFYGAEAFATDNAMQANEARRQAVIRRRWGRFSLRAFLIVVTLVCISVGWQANRARRQGEAVLEVQRLGGVVKFGYQYDDQGSFQSDREPSAPAWLREALGEELFRDVVVLDLSYGGPRKGENRITDERLSLIEGLPDLTTLELGRELGITDEGLIHLRGLKQLKTLYLYNTGVEGPGLRYLRRLTNLESITLHGTPLTDEGLSHLAALPQLKWLSLGATRISDDGIKHLTNLRSLLEASLSDTDITDAGLEHLKRISGLTSVELYRTRVTADGVAELQAALPKCKVSPAADDLRRTPVDIELWPEGDRPTATELTKRARDLGLDFDAVSDANRPGQPIVSVRLFNSDVSADSLLRVLAETPELETLNLRDLVVGDELLRNMPALPNLRYLSLKNCRITDEALNNLSKYTGLHELYIDENYITDSGAEEFKKLANLEQLGLNNNRIRYKARLELKQALPGCAIGL